MSEDYTNLKYELIPYDNFVGSDAFDFNKTIYDLNSQMNCYQVKRITWIILSLSQAV